MVAVNKIDSNVTGLRYAEEVEDCIGVLPGEEGQPGTPVWNLLFPNSYDNFGGEISTIESNPINPSRQQQKGVTSDLDASGGFNQDLTQTGLRDLLQGFLFADERSTANTATTAAETTGDTFTVASGQAVQFLASDLILVAGFSDATNNGIKTVSVDGSGTSVPVSENLVDESASGTLTTVGHQFATGDLEVDASGTLPALITTVKDLTELDIVAGSWIYIGGDTTATTFATAANNGFARVKSVTANRAELDKTAGTMVTDVGTGKTVRVFISSVIKNENDPTLIKRRSYNLERTLGAPDAAQPTQIQAEYLVGSVPNELTLNFQGQDKANADLSFMSIDHQTRDGTTGVKSGTRPTTTAGTIFNTSSDFSRLKMSIIDSSTSNPTALFAYVTEFSVTVNNNVSTNKAIGSLGAIDATAGQFNVEGTATAWFSTVDAVQAIRDNSDVTFDFALVKNNAGIVVDLPLIALNDGRVNVVQDQLIDLPLGMGAAEDPTYNHTLLFSFFDYLPTAAG